MKVILNQDIKGQGKKGQLVEVSDGYARNYLLPKKLASEANNANINILNGKNESEAYRKQVALEEATAQKEKMEKIEVRLSAKAGENGKLFGSITSKDVSEALTMQHHIKIDKKKFVMPDGIKVLGTTNVEVKIHPGVVGNLKVTVTQQ
ncbi:MAG: 50S ribosomal protein L9 [Firmicutes bacterium]|nr:50S ribosomal protein L9 [Bacillota bacterium]HAL63035.1 50S ribosomal protein L9 [Clostridiales bacterium]